MSPAPATTPDTDPDLAALIARAERRRAGLERLGEAALAVSIEIAKRMVESPYHPEPRHEPGRAFASASRAVRLTYAMEARVDERIFAMRKGGIGAILAPATDGMKRAEAAQGGALVEREPVDRDDGRPREDLVDRERADQTPTGRQEGALTARSNHESSGHPEAGPGNEHRAFPPPRSRPEGESRPPHFGGGRGMTTPAMTSSSSAETSGADPPPLE